MWLNKDLNNSFKPPILLQNDPTKPFKDIVPLHLRDEIDNYTTILKDNQNKINNFIHDGDLTEQELNQLDDLFEKYNMNVVDIHNYNNKLILIIKSIEENDNKEIY